MPGLFFCSSDIALHPAERMEHQGQKTFGCSDVLLHTSVCVSGIALVHLRILRNPFFVLSLQLISILKIKRAYFENQKGRGSREGAGYGITSLERKCMKWAGRTYGNTVPRSRFAPRFVPFAFWTACASRRRIIFPACMRSATIRSSIIIRHPSRRKAGECADFLSRIRCCAGFKKIS